MNIVAVYGWQKEEAEVAETIGILVFEARQKLADGGPVALATFADPTRAETLASRLSGSGVPAITIDPRYYAAKTNHSWCEASTWDPSPCRLSQAAANPAPSLHINQIAACSDLRSQPDANHQRDIGTQVQPRQNGACWRRADDQKKKPVKRLR
ncbi:MAG TPA: hypothetical protein VJ974_03030 [Geopsychrobacteraceae bacterium]|nr:hypothetical protein [Geopsychrobacteraceae bacterium]